jgi:hypothetical protein
MQKRFRFSSAHVIALIALFAALGGTAFGLAKNSVKSKNIVNNEVKSKDLKNESIKGKDVKDNTLTGSQIDESSLSLNGSSSSDPCDNGYVKAFAQIDQGQLSTSFATVPGYNCTGGTVQARRAGTGDYEIRWGGIPIDSTTNGLVAHGNAVGGSGPISFAFGTTASDDLVTELYTSSDGQPVDKTFGVSLINIGE